MAVLYWFRHDLRTHDNPALALAVSTAHQLGQPLHALWVQDDAWLQPTRWGFARCGPKRLSWWQGAARTLQATLAAQGIHLHKVQGQPAAVVQHYCAKHGINQVFCEAIAAPYEQGEVAALEQAGLRVSATWQSSLLCPKSLPFQIADLPQVFTRFRELAATGWLSNRMRQVVASYLVHDLVCDWRAGAAWFESQLLDYDPYSNQGNWLYIAGRGTDPRQGRRFNPDLQAQQYDPHGSYQQHWMA